MFRVLLITDAARLFHGPNTRRITLSLGDLMFFFFTFGPPADGREAPVGRLSRMYL